MTPPPLLPAHPPHPPHPYPAPLCLICHNSITTDYLALVGALACKVCGGMTHSQCTTTVPDWCESCQTATMGSVGGIYDGGLGGIQSGIQGSELQTELQTGEDLLDGLEEGLSDDEFGITVQGSQHLYPPGATVYLPTYVPNSLTPYPGEPLSSPLPAKRTRKPYTKKQPPYPNPNSRKGPHPHVAVSASSSTSLGRWTDEEQRQFLEGLNMHGKAWKVVARCIPTRSIVQVRSHAQKYFQMLEKPEKFGHTPSGRKRKVGRGGEDEGRGTHIGESAAAWSMPPPHILRGQAAAQEAIEEAQTEANLAAKKLKQRVYSARHKTAQKAAQAKAAAEQKQRTALETNTPYYPTTSTGITTTAVTGGLTPNAAPHGVALAVAHAVAQSKEAGGVHTDMVHEGATRAAAPVLPPSALRSRLTPKPTQPAVAVNDAAAEWHYCPKSGCSVRAKLPWMISRHVESAHAGAAVPNGVVVKPSIEIKPPIASPKKVPEYVKPKYVKPATVKLKCVYCDFVTEGIRGAKTDPYKVCRAAIEMHVETKHAFQSKVEEYRKNAQANKGMASTSSDVI